MFKLEEDVLYVELPQGMTMGEITKEALYELQNLKKSFYGKDVKINGRCTTALAVVLGHELAHICRSVSVFDPKENEYVVCVMH